MGKNKMLHMGMIYLIVITTLFAVGLSVVEAEEGINGSGGGPTGNQGSSNVIGGCYPVNNASFGGYGSRMAIKMTVEFRYGSNGRTVLGHPIYIYRDSGATDDLRSRSDSYQGPNNWFNKNDGHAVNDENIYNDLLGGRNKEERRKNLETWLKRMGLSYSNSQLKRYANISCPINGKNSSNCAGKDGLRLIIEDVIFTENCWDGFSDSCYCGDGTTMNWGNYLNGQVSDTNIVHDDTCNKNNAMDKFKSCALNYYDITQEVKSYNYSIDAACTNCNSTLANNTAYIIQDTSDWEAILAANDYKDSSDEKEQKIYKHFHFSVGGSAGCNVYCRESYIVKFPNKKDNINVTPGRYFTVNAQTTGKELADGIFNFRPVEVKKVRECRALGGNENICLAKMKSGDTGNITLAYKENITDSKYTGKFDLTENKNRMVEKNETINSPLDGSTYIKRMTKTVYYELPDNLYRFVQHKDGLSVKEPVVSKMNKYNDLIINNLPISFENFSNDKKEAATIMLKYTLPEKMNKAFNKNNDYFGNQETDNIYKKVENGEANKKGTACYLMYGESGYGACANDRKSNSAGDCYNKIHNDDNYSCPINTCAKGKTPCKDGTCPNEGETCPPCEKEEKRCDDGTCPSEGETCPRKCKYEDGKYYLSNGQYQDETGRDYTEEDFMADCPKDCGKYEVGGKTYYFNTNKQLISKERFYELYPGGKCPNDPGDGCPNECIYGCCPSGICAPMPGGVCPGGGDNKIIYRVIDLNNPFPARNATGRETGSNWCTYNKTTKKTTCSGSSAGDNTIMTKNIPMNRDSEGYSVYNATPLYEFDLTANDIKNIRNYNKGHDYDDFTLECDQTTENGVCKSTFFRHGVLSISKGVCSGSGYDNLATCAEKRG